MNPHVPLTVRGLTETLAAYAAVKGLLSRMNPAVYSQASLVVRTVGTFAALVLLVARHRTVPLHVQLPSSHRGEAVRAFGARKFLDELLWPP